MHTWDQNYDEKSKWIKNSINKYRHVRSTLKYTHKKYVISGAVLINISLFA